MYFSDVNRTPNMTYCMRAGNDTVLDSKTGDVNGDGVPDYVYLTGTKSGTSQGIFENIRLLIRDSKTQTLAELPLHAGYNRGFNPTVALFDFTGDKINDIFITIPFSIWGKHHYIFSFAKGKFNTLLGPKQFYSLNQELEFEAVYKDYYKIEFVSTKLGKRITLDLSDSKELYEGYIYDKKGNLLRPAKGVPDNSVDYIPVSFDDTYGLIMLQRVRNGFGPGIFGFLQSFWRYNPEKSIWEVNKAWTGVFLW